MAKRESRSAQRQRLQEAASHIAVPDTCDVVVVGGGAAGLIAAIVAAEAGATVVVLERELECGKTILATGNGRCNFANIRLDPRRYNNPAFVQDVCGTRWLDDVLSFFRACGLRWGLEDDRLYPMSRQAASVRNVLLARARKADVVLAPAREVVQVAQGAVTYRLDTGHDEPLATLHAPSVILATGGGLSAAIESLGLRVLPTAPVLCPLACEPSPLSALDGRRALAQAQLTKADSFFPSWRERGEVLFRPYGISGILTFDLSRRAEQGDLVELDLVPDVNMSELRQLIDPFVHGDFESGCIDGIVDPAIAAMLEGLAHERWHIDWAERDQPTSDSDALIKLLKALPLVVSGPAETEHAQVTRGGLDVDQFDSATLASHELPWLHACGEALDIDADCGGFNLAWAWKSGMVAGAAAARRPRS